MSNEHTHEEPPRRWRDGATGADPMLDDATALIRGALVPGDPGDAWVGPVRQRIHERRRRFAFSPSKARLALSVAACLTIASVAAYAAYQVADRAGWLAPASANRASTSRPKVSQSSPQAPSERPRSDSLEQPGASAEDARQVLLEPGKPEGKRDPALHAGFRKAAPRSAPSPRDEAALAEVNPPPADEIQALEHAVGLLRKGHDARAALVELDGYLARYPAGVLAREARVARVDALLMLNQSDAALAALETLPFDAHGRSTELQVVRGELRARSSCARAEEDFSAVLGRTSDKILLERALYGRASCRAKRGDSTGATADVESYLDRFPTGAHATWARKWQDSAHKP